jgi:hypothetical protein
MRSKDLDAQLAERALRLGWPVPEPLRGACVKILWTLIKDQTVAPRERIAAIKALMLADQREETAIATVMGVDAHTDLATRIEALEQQQKQQEHPPDAHPDHLGKVPVGESPPAGADPGDPGGVPPGG